MLSKTMKNKIFKILFIAFLLITIVGCDNKPNNNNNDPIVEPIIEPTEEYTQIVYLDENDKTIKSKFIIKNSELILDDCPAKEYYDSKWVLLDSSTEDKKIYKVEYTLNQTEFSISYVISEDKLSYNSKDEMVKRFLLDFYDFVNPEIDLVTFLYGSDLECQASLKNGNYKTYFGGSFGKNNKLIYNNDIDADNDNYFFNSKQYKDKWYHLASYVRNNICKSNKRFGYSDVEYYYGALDFYRYLMSEDGSYIDTYGGENIFYGYPTALCELKKEYSVNKIEYIPTIYNSDFLGWYKDASYKDGPIDNTEYCVGDLKLYPKWKQNGASEISFFDDDGSIIEVKSVNNNDVINLPTVEKEGAKFIGWYIRNDRIQNFTYQFDCDINLYAKWSYDNQNDLINLEYDGKTVYYNDSYNPVSFYEDYVEKEEGSEELRAVWVSSFIKGFTPSKDEATMKSELLKVLNVLQQYNINCIFFHLRTHNNAYYKTKLAPTTSINNSEYGSYEDFENFDYVPWLIEECHKRGIEFHAWLNPYRIAMDGYSWNDTTEAVAEKYKDYPLNPASKAGNILLTYGSKTKGTRGAILNPAKTEVQDYLVDVVKELMNNYNLDGIHFDDYFYAQLNETGAILDDDDQQDYLDSLTKLSSIHIPSEEDKASWRRNNVNTLIYKLHNAISEYNKANNKSIQFGISPTCMYRNGDGSVESGANVSYRGHYGDDLYADTYLWAKNGWIDYLMPQLYMPFVNARNNFADMAEWWNRAFEGLDCNLYFGIANYNMLSNYGSWIYEEEMFNQLKYIQTLSNCKGVSLFSSTYLVNDTLNVPNMRYSLYQRLKNEFWTRTMKVPASRIKNN